VKSQKVSKKKRDFCIVPLIILTLYNKTLMVAKEEEELEAEWISGDELELFEGKSNWVDASKHGCLSKLLSAAEFGNADFCSEALRDIEDEFVNAKGDDGDTSLHLACLYGHVDVVKVLLSDERVDVNARDDDDGTSLADASASGFHEIVALLLAKKGIEVNLKDSDGETALDCAIRGEHEKCVELLKAAGGKEGEL
jgi:ankyrin repeat protein